MENEMHESQNSSNSFVNRVRQLPAVPVVVALVLLILVTFAGIYIFRGNKPNPKVVKLVETGNSSLRKANYSQAQKDFTNAYNLDKNSPAVQAGLINSYSLEGNQKGNESEQLKKSLPIIESSLKANPDNVDVLVSAGYAYETAGDYKRAEELYKKATQLDSKSSDAWFGLGHVSQFLGKEKEAQQYYDKSYELNPKNPNVNIVRANTQFSNGKLDDAFNSFKTAANELGVDNSTSAEALTGAATVLLNKDHFSYIAQADAIAKQAVDADPNFAPALGVYGFTQYLRGNADNAILYLEKATKANPRISKNYNYLGLVYREKKNYKAAIQNFNLSIDTADSDNTIFTPEARNLSKSLATYELAKTYAEAGDNASAMLTLKHVVQMDARSKQRIANDATNTNIFANVVADPEFQSLIN